MGRSPMVTVPVAMLLATLGTLGIHPAPAAAELATSVVGPAGMANETGSRASQLWVKRYDGKAGLEDYASTVGVSADGSTVFVSGFSSGSNGAAAYSTLAYDSATGKKRWSRLYDRRGGFLNFGPSLAVDPNGSTVFITGSHGSPADYATVAYDASTGKKRWARRYDGPANGIDYPTAIGVSADGSTVFVTGVSRGTNSSDDYATVAYDASTGMKRWARRYNDGLDGNDRASALGLSPNGDIVYVTGSAVGRYATVAYEASTGHRLWTVIGPPDGALAGASSLAVSLDGALIFVAGGSLATNGDDYATVAYLASTGKQLWLKHYDGSADKVDDATAVDVSSDGSTVFVTGHSTEVNSLTDYTTIAYDVGTGERKWLMHYDGGVSGNDFAYAMAISTDGAHVFVTGGSDGSGGSADYATVAYDAVTGAERWVERYAGPGGGDDTAYAMAVSPDSARVFVTGGSNGLSSRDYATVAYSTS